MAARHAFESRAPPWHARALHGDPVAAPRNGHVRGSILQHAGSFDIFAPPLPSQYWTMTMRQALDPRAPGPHAGFRHGECAGPTKNGQRACLGACLIV